MADMIPSRTTRGFAATLLLAWVAACGDGGTEPPANRAPLAVGTIPPQSLHVGDTATLDVAGYFTDPDGDTLIYTAGASNPATATAGVNGSRVTVAAVTQGSSTISVTATDPDGLSATQSFGVTVPNRAPLPVDSIASLELVKGDSATIDVADYFTDPDGDSLSYSVETSNAGTATPTVEGSQVTVAALTQGSAIVSVTATDAGGLSATNSFNVTVHRPPLVVTFATAAASAPEGDTVVLRAEVSAAPEDPLTVFYTLGSDSDPATADADDADFAGGNRGTLDFAPGANSTNLRIAIKDDNDIEPPREVVAVALDSPGPDDEYLLGSIASAVVTIDEGICDRTPEIQDEIIRRARVGPCAAFTRQRLARIKDMQLCFIPNNPNNCRLQRPLTVLKSEDFQDLTGLTLLSLSHNHLTELPARLFNGLSRLTTLHLNSNHLASLPRGVFDGLSALKRLSLQYNQLDSLPGEMFVNLPQLDTLLLNHNQLVDLPRDFFLGTSGLGYLNLLGNPGSPFPLAMQLRRTDHTDLLAPGPATVDIRIAQGTPFEIGVPMSADGGELSADSAVMEAGSTHSTEVSVVRTADGQGGTLVSAGSADMPEGMWGITIGEPDPIVLFPPTGDHVVLSTGSISAPEGARPGLAVLLNPPPSSPLTLTYSLGIDDDPATDDADSVDFNGAVLDTLNIGAGTIRATIEVAIADDDDIEPPRESIILSLHEPGEETGYVLGYPREAVLTIEEGVCDRTPQIRDGLVRRANAAGCTDVEFRDLQGITSLTISPATRQAPPVPDPEDNALASEYGGTETAWTPCIDSYQFLTLERYDSQVPQVPQCQSHSTDTSTPEPAAFPYPDPITALRTRDFWGLSSLGNLDLSYNQIEELPLGMLADLPALQRIQLYRNRIRSVPWGDLANTPWLRQLGLNQNRLSHLPSRLSDYAPNLRALDLQHNLLTRLPEDAFTGLFSLKVLGLGFNPLKSLPAKVFADLSSLTFLDLQRLQAPELAPDILLPLNSLEILWLTLTPLRVMPLLAGLSDLRSVSMFGHYQLREIPPGAFLGLSSLELLVLSNNRQMHLRANMFAGLHNLRYLSMSSSQLEAIPPGVFSELSSLRHLVLHNNILSELSADDFADIPHLERLILGDNLFTAVTLDMLSGLPSLWDLRLNGNEIAAISGGAFKNLDSLQSLWLDGNELTELPAGMFSGLTKLKELLLHDNPGAPFILSPELVRTDNADLLAPGPATVEVRLDQGAPFNIRIPLFVHDGGVSAAVVGLKVGAEASSNVTVTQASGSQAGTQVVAGPPPAIPKGVTGVELAFPDPLVLFAEPANRAPVPEREIRWLRLRAGRDTISISPSLYFRDPDGDELQFTARSASADIVSATAADDRVEVAALSGGTGTVTVAATDPGGLSAELSFPVVVRGGYSPGSFDIELVQIDHVSESVSAALADAVGYWEALLGPTDLPDVPVGTDFELGCGDIVADQQLDAVDDLVIVASVREFDGPRGILAAAGVCAVREESGLPFMGVVGLDAADVAWLEETGDMEEVILHEIGHTLGIGTIWSDLGLLVNPSLSANGEADTHFTGPLAIGAFDDAGGTEYVDGEKVPVENRAGPGSRDSHWREAVLYHELMTPYQDIGFLDGLSAVTVQSLADLGYTVDLTLAEPFRLPGTLAADFNDAARKVAYGDDIIRGPILVVDRNGRVVRVVPQ